MTRLLPWLLLGLGLGLWGWSLFLPAFYPVNISQPPVYGPPESGLEVLRSGVRGWWLLLLIPLGWGWWANPLMLAALLACMFGKHGLGMMLSTAALLMAQSAWLFYCFSHGPGGDLTPPALTSHSTGFFAWDIALALICAGTWLLLWRSLPPESQPA